MQWGKKVKRLLSAAVSGVMLLTMTAALPIETNAASVCTVNTNKTYQRIRGFGGINLPEWAGSDMTEAHLQKAFGNGADELGLSILRIYVSDDSNAWSRAVPTAKRAQALANCDLFGTHFYGTQRSQMDSPAIENSGKELWMTEVSVANSNANSANNYPEALQVSENIHNGLVVGGLNAYDLSGAVSPACQHQLSDSGGRVLSRDLRRDSGRHRQLLH